MQRIERYAAQLSDVMAILQTAHTHASTPGDRDRVAEAAREFGYALNLLSQTDDKWAESAFGFGGVLPGGVS